MYRLYTLKYYYLLSKDAYTKQTRQLKDTVTHGAETNKQFSHLCGLVIKVYKRKQLMDQTNKPKSPTFVILGKNNEKFYMMHT